MISTCKCRFPHPPSPPPLPAGRPSRSRISSLGSNRNYFLSLESNRNYISSLEYTRNYILSLESTRNYISNLESARKYILSLEYTRNYFSSFYRLDDIFRAWNYFVIQARNFEPGNVEPGMHPELLCHQAFIARENFYPAAPEKPYF